LLWFKEIAKLPDNVNEDELKGLLSEYGKVEKLLIASLKPEPDQVFLPSKTYVDVKSLLDLLHS